MISARNDAEKFRLSPTELNFLLHQLIVSIEPNIPSRFPGDYQIIDKEDKKIVVFPMSKDAQTQTNEADLQFVGNVIDKFRLEHPNQNYLLLLPMRMCRGYLSVPPSLLKRKHAVLVEIDLKADFEKTVIRVHDSQGGFRWWLYPDKISQIARGNSFQYKSNSYHSYGAQGSLFAPDIISCGYYVFEYVRHIIETGSSLGCENIKLDIAHHYDDKWDYFKKNNIEVVSEEIPIKEPVVSSILSFEVGEDSEIILEDDQKKKDGSVKDFTLFRNEEKMEETLADGMRKNPSNS